MGLKSQVSKSLYTPLWSLDGEGWRRIQETVMTSVRERFVKISDDCQEHG